MEEARENLARFRELVMEQLEATRRDIYRDIDRVDSSGSVRDVKIAAYLCAQTEGLCSQVTEALTEALQLHAENIKNSVLLSLLRQV